MSEKLLVQKVRTNKGDIPIDYNCLENAPKFDAAWKTEHGIADITSINTALGSKAEQKDLDSAIQQIQADLNLRAYSTEVTAHRVEVDNQFAFLDLSLEKKYVTKASLESATYVTELQLDEYMDDNGYVTAAQLSSGSNFVATDNKPGMIKPGDGLTVINGTLHVDKHPMEDLSNLYICQDGMPDLSTIIDGGWYLVKVTE